MKEYLEHIKKITDSFIEMQSHNDLIVVWNGGIDFAFMKPEEQYRDRSNENFEYNSKIALEYLKINMVSYEQFLLK